MRQVKNSTICDCLCELSDIAYQELVWKVSSGLEISSFTEVVCRLFNDTGLDVELEKGNVVFSVSIDDKLKKLGILLSLIDDSKSPSEIIENPKMKLVRELCKEILEQLFKVQIFE